MKKITSLCLIIMSSTLLKAQSYIGFLTDNYSGINSVIVNPANITDSRFKTDINLAGASAFISNDYYGVKFIDAIEDGYDFDTEALNIDVMGPAFMFNLNEISSIAVFTRGRSIININEFNGSSAEIIEDETTDDFSINEGDFSVIGNSWAELGITYARTLINKGDKFLKGGLTAKYLKGYGSGYLRGKNIKLDYIDSDPVFSGNSSVDVEGEIGYGRFDNFDNEDYDYETPKANGFGVDLGFIFEWRPNHNNYVKTNSAGESYVLKDKNKYKLKLGLSITDIGGINYKNGREDSYSIPNIEGSFSSNDFEDSEDLQDFLQNQYGSLNTKSSKGYKVKLPTALHLNADWSYNAKLYVNLNTDLSLVAKGKDNANRIANIVSLTPRFESKWFSFYLPLSVIENNGFQVGSGLRAGPLYIGSGSAISALTSKNTKGTDAYAGLKIPIYQRRPKDR